MNFSHLFNNISLGSVNARNLQQSHIIMVIGLLCSITSSEMAVYGSSALKSIQNPRSFLYQYQHHSVRLRMRRRDKNRLHDPDKTVVRR